MGYVVKNIRPCGMSPNYFSVLFSEIKHRLPTYVTYLQLGKRGKHKTNFLVLPRQDTYCIAPYFFIPFSSISSLLTPPSTSYCITPTYTIEPHHQPTHLTYSSYFCILFSSFHTMLYHLQVRSSSLVRICIFYFSLCFVCLFAPWSQSVRGRPLHSLSVTAEPQA